MSRTPIILKKDDSQRSARHQNSLPIQPKILTKANNKENVPLTIQKKNLEHQEGGPKKDPPLMKSCQRMMSPHFQIDQKVMEYLDNDNTDFLVVGIIGRQCVGKSVIGNIIASPNYLQIDEESEAVTFLKKHEVFPTAGAIYEGNAIDMFITVDRIIFLDTSPLLSIAQRRDMMVAECEDLKLLLMMLQLCHLILFVHDGFPDMQVIRLMKVAEQMIPTHMKHRPKFAYIGNRVQPGTKTMEINPRLHFSQEAFSQDPTDMSYLTVPNFFHRSVFLHCDVQQVVQELQEKVYMSGRRSMTDEDEAFTEKVWSQRLVAVMEQMKNDYFLRKYEALRDKFHQETNNKD